MQEQKPLTKTLRLNAPQFRSLLHHAQTTVNLWSRGTGKTFEIGRKSSRIAYELPGSLSVFVGRTLPHLLDVTLQSVVSSWTDLGYKEGIHYVSRTRPPANWPRPFNRPMRYDNVISWHTGSAFILASQETIFRGGNVDAVFLDEALEAKKDHFEDEILAANRGNKHRFGGHPLHHTITISSSMPHGKRGRWILDYGNYYEESNCHYDPILNKIVDLEWEFVNAYPHQPEKCKKLFMEISRMKKRVKWFVHDSVYYNQADSFDNVHNLGWDYFKQLKRNMSELKFKIEVCNKRPHKVESGFYPDLKNDHIDFNSSPANPNISLHIACDYGGSFNCMVVAQKPDGLRKINFIDNFYAEHPGKITDVVQKFCDHYHAHPHRHIHYYYDQTAIGTDGKDALTYKQIVINLLRQNNWAVYEHYMGKAPNHYKKYEMWAFAFNNNPKVCAVEFSKLGCKDLIFSMEQAPIRKNRESFEKDKSSEDPKNNIPQVEATHLSDAADQLMWGLNNLADGIDMPYFG